MPIFYLEYLKLNSIFLCLLCSLFVSCSSPTTQKETSNAAKDSLGIMFDNQKPFEIQSLKTLRVYTTFFEDSLECKEWTISKEALSRIIKNSQPISGTEQDLAFANHSCAVSARVLQANKYFEIELNGGAWMYITCRDTTLLFGDFNKLDSSYFLSVPVSDE